MRQTRQRRKGSAGASEFCQRTKVRGRREVFNPKGWRHGVAVRKIQTASRAFRDGAGKSCLPPLPDRGISFFDIRDQLRHGNSERPADQKQRLERRAALAALQPPDGVEVQPRLRRQRHLAPSLALAMRAQDLAEDFWKRWRHIKETSRRDRLKYTHYCVFIIACPLI